MVSIAYVVCLILTLGMMMNVIWRNYKNIDTYHWAITIIFPIVILGYWLNSISITPGEAYVSYCFIYLDSTILLTIMLFSIARFLNIQINRVFKISAYAMTMIHLFIVWCCKDNKLYYKMISLEFRDAGTYVKTEDGPLKIIHYIYLVIILVAIISLLVYGVVHNGTYSRITLGIYITLCSVGLIIYFIEMLVDAPFSSLPFLYVIGDFIMVLNYEYAKQYDIYSLITDRQKEVGKRGYVAVDKGRRFLGINNRGLYFFPSLKKQVIDKPISNDADGLKEFFDELIDEYQQYDTEIKDYYINDCVYRCRISEFSIRDDGKIRGYLFEVTDVTDDVKHLKNIEETVDKQSIALMISQMQPHFLYNMLTTIALLCTEDPDEAEETTLALSRYLRSNLDALRTLEPVTFKKEMNYIREYLGLEKKRFKDKINVEYDIDVDDFNVPALGIQPIVENSVKHGISKKETGGTLKISTKRVDGGYEIIIEDDGVGFDMEAGPKNDGRSHVGMINVRERLMKMCRASMEVTSSPGCGCRTVIHIPE